MSTRVYEEIEELQFPSPHSHYQLLNTEPHTYAELRNSHSEALGYSLTILDNFELRFFFAIVLPSLVLPVDMQSIGKSNALTPPMKSGESIHISYIGCKPNVSFGKSIKESSCGDDG